jgi:hypothetical protein
LISFAANHLGQDGDLTSVVGDDNGEASPRAACHRWPGDIWHIVHFSGPFLRQRPFLSTIFEATSVLEQHLCGNVRSQERFFLARNKAEAVA